MISWYQGKNFLYVLSGKMRPDIHVCRPPQSAIIGSRHALRKPVSDLPLFSIEELEVEFKCSGSEKDPHDHRRVKYSLEWLAWDVSDGAEVQAIVSLQHSMTKLYRGLRNSLYFLQSSKILSINAGKEPEEPLLRVERDIVTSAHGLGMLWCGELGNTPCP